MEQTKLEDEEDLDKKIYSVSGLNHCVKSLLEREDEIQDVWVKGEISNFKHYDGRHMYFVLKDDTSEINSVMFRSKNRDLDFEPEEGMEVLCRGDVGLYVPRGQYQLVVKEMMVGGIGELYLAYERLKEKLSKEGLFEEDHKKEIPFLPQKVGIVTSGEGAALRDMLRVLKERFENIDVFIAPTRVQGEESADEIVNSIRKLDRMEMDVIIIGRGGGSIEDLWSFNEEKVARAVFGAETPIVSAVGHETDFLISDFVADERAPTPTGAAEIVVPSKSELKKKINEQQRRSATALNNLILSYREKLESLAKSPVFQKPERILEDRYQKLDENREKIGVTLDRYMKTYQQRLEGQKDRLKALSPIQTMKRGYSIVMDEANEVITSVDEVSVKDILRINLTDGEIKTKTEEVERCQKNLRK
ncbi:MAG: exodeoxyribonuclease VII large subunit [Candidatus Thermoplasmatota archaeon]|nr:exodeoxyribonuclease VII large subunit [Candidatus Thermoplasmatota archaeon]MBS3790701.1 exodeoxyribonuclease VII large subunit [Candidatus Thermoplasmatota archaeon]